MVHQNFMLVPNMTVTENVALGLKQHQHFMNLDLKAVKQRILEVSAHHELPVNPDAYVWQLSVGEQQRVELIKTLCFGARLLILDEPTSALTPQETDDLIDRLKRMSAELSIIFISHKLNEVKSLSNRVAILRHGAVVFNGFTVDHSTSDLAALMTGREVVLPHNEGMGEGGAAILSATNLKVRGDRGHLALDGLDLVLHAGEILGLAGVSGNGQRELAEALTGLRPVESGTVALLDQDMTNRTPAAMIEAGLGYIPEDRHHEGIVPSFTVKENLVLKDFNTTRFSCLVPAQAEGDRPQRRIPQGLLRHPLQLHRRGRRLPFRRQHPEGHPGPGAGPGTQGPGGGLPRPGGWTWAPRSSSIRSCSHRRRAGGGILLISEELEEIMNLSDRIAVIYKGRILKVLPSLEATRERLGLLMAGVEDELVGVSNE